MKTKMTIEKINESKTWFFKNLNKIDQLFLVGNIGLK